MPMPEPAQDLYIFKYLNIFGSETPSDIQEDERKNIKVAGSIRDFVNSKPLAGLKLEQKQPLYKEVNTDRPDLLRGTLLYGCFSVDDYSFSDHVSKDEKKLLDSLYESFMALYVGSDKPVDHVEQLIEKATEWLKLPHDSLESRPEADKLCRSLYAILTIIDKSINSSSFSSMALKAAARFALGGAKFDALNSQITGTLGALERKSKALCAPVVLAQTEPTSNTLQTHFNTVFKQTISNGTTENELSQLEGKLTDMNNDLTDLIAQRKSEASTESAGTSLKSNSNSTANEKTHLHPVLKKAYSMIVPKKTTAVQEPINEPTPLKEKNTEIPRLCKKISNNDGAFEACLVNASVPELEQVQQANLEVMKVVAESKSMLGHMKNLEKINALDGFIDKHNDWKVRLSNLFSKLHSIFKSDSAKMIDEAQLFQRDLASLKNEYEASLAEHMGRHAPILTELGVKIERPAVDVRTKQQFNELKDAYNKMLQSDAPKSAISEKNRPCLSALVDGRSKAQCIANTFAEAVNPGGGAMEHALEQDVKSLTEAGAVFKRK